MQIEYCPECDKAGLRNRAPEHLKIIRPPHTDKWCPRCQKYVKGVNRKFVPVWRRKQLREID